MRLSRLPLVLAPLLLGLVAAPARADDGPAAMDPAVPIYSIEYLMPGEDDLPEGWRRKDRGAPAGAPTEDALVALGEACDCGLDLDTFYVEAAVLRAGGEGVGVAMVDTDRSVAAFRRVLDAAATEGGWRLVELGAPGRLLVVGAGAKQAAAVEMLSKHVAYRFADLAVGRIRGAGGRTEKGRAAALAYAAALQAMVPGAGAALAVEGLVRELEAQPEKQGEPVDEAKRDAAIAAWRAAFAKDAPVPPTGSLRVYTAGRLGGLLLEKKEAAVLAEARRVLSLAVEHEGEARSSGQRYGNRYNLACALARSGEVEPALDMLEGALVIAKAMPSARWFQAQIEHIREKDADMEPLRGTERFQALMAKYAPKAAGGEPHPGGAPKKADPEKADPKKADPKKDG